MSDHDQVPQVIAGFECFIGPINPRPHELALEARKDPDYIPWTGHEPGPLYIIATMGEPYFTLWVRHEHGYCLVRICFRHMYVSDPHQWQTKERYLVFSVEDISDASRRILSVRKGRYLKVHMKASTVVAIWLLSQAEQRRLEQILFSNLSSDDDMEP